VGINRPRADAAPDEVYRIALLRDQAFATSGDYRNNVVRDGVRYSHVIDPRTGRPVTNRVVSASIRAPDCTLADGLATAVMVMGAEAGLALVERLDDVEGLVVVGTPEGGLHDHPSSGFRSEPPSRQPVGAGSGGPAIGGRAEPRPRRSSAASAPASRPGLPWRHS
jgi:thiamine biosynthesis lipoprotein